MIVSTSSGLTCSPSRRSRTTDGKRCIDRRGQFVGQRHSVGEVFQYTNSAFSSQLNPLDEFAAGQHVPHVALVDAAIMIVGDTV